MPEMWFSFTKNIINLLCSTEFYLRPISACIEKKKKEQQKQHLPNFAVIRIDAKPWFSALIKELFIRGQHVPQELRSYINSELWKISPIWQPALTFLLQRDFFLMQSSAVCVTVQKKKEYFSTQSWLGFNIPQGDIWHCTERITPLWVIFPTEPENEQSVPLIWPM